jgi:hypothetical protein
MTGRPEDAYKFLSVRFLTFGVVTSQYKKILKMNGDPS